MKISCVIPFKNDFEDLDKVLAHLLSSSSTESNNIEIIIVNDGGVYGSGKFHPIESNLPNVRVINNPVSFGVGFSFDRGVEQARGDIIVLMGADVYPREGWYDKVVDAVNSRPETLGCAVCVGLNPTRMSLDDPENYRRYGADLLFYVDSDDLPRDSALRARRGGYTDLFHAKWLPDKQSDKPHEIPCVLGAFYFCTKEYYTKLGGWDTVPRNRYIGHRVWSHLEPYISLKSWLVGGGCTLYPDIEAGHVFGRIDVKNQFSKGARSAEWMMWNSIFMLETMILSDFLRNRLYDFMHFELNWGVALKMIKEHRQEVGRVREQNRLKFKYDHTIFKEKFEYSFDI